MGKMKVNEFLTSNTEAVRSALESIKKGGFIRIASVGKISYDGAADKYYYYIGTPGDAPAARVTYDQALHEIQTNEIYNVVL